MKLLQFVHGYPPELAGGTERYVQALSRALQERGERVAAVSYTHLTLPTIYSV